MWRPALLLLLLTQGAAALVTRGASPEVASLLSRLSTFACDGGSRRLPLQRFNDDYCDCQDGTDEPGTSACPNGRFFCPNEGHAPERVFSSRVNDGVCDCCDGSDEWSGRAQCANSCLEVGRAAREQLTAEAAAHKEGLEARARLVADAQQSALTWRAELGELEHALSAQEAHVAALAAQKAAAEAEHAAAQAQAPAGEGAAAGEAGEAARSEPEGAPQQEAVPVEESDEERGRRIARQWTNDAAAAGPAAPQTADQAGAARLAAVGHHSDAHAQQQQQQHADADAEPDAGAGAGGDAGGDDYAVAGSEDEGGEDELSADEMEQQNNLDDVADAAADAADASLSPPAKPLAALTSRVSSWLGRKKVVPPAAPPATPPAAAHTPPAPPSALEALRAEHGAADAKLSELRQRRGALQALLGPDGGPDGVLTQLSGQCFELQSDGYTYRVCPFDGATQEPGGTSLGRWAGVAAPPEGVPPASVAGLPGALNFQGGTPCWNGPARSLRVELQCGATHQLLKVDEPNRCEYRAHLATPAACTQQLADASAARAQEAMALVERVRRNSAAEL